MRRSSTLLALLLLAACRRKPPPAPDSDPVPGLPPLPEIVLAFEPEMDREASEPAQPPAQWTPCWDLGAGAKHVFRIDQRIMTRSTSKDRYGTAAIQSSVRGEGYVDIDGPRARYKMSLRESVVNGRPQDVNEQPPAKIEYRLDEDGTVRDAKSHSGGDAQAVEFLFPLPDRPLRAGERTSRPYRAGGTYLQTGTVTVTLAAFVRSQGTFCARLDTDFAIDLAPASGDGSGLGKMRARTVAYFDVAARRFIRSDAAVSFVYHTRGRVSREGGGDLWSVGTIESHTLLRARLQ